MNKFTPEQKEKYKAFAERQMNEIENGFKNGLSEEQIDVYARPEFDASQMYAIRMGFINGLSMEQISIYAKPEFDRNQMWEIIDGFKKGLSVKQVRACAKPEFDRLQMIEIKDGFKKGLSLEQVDIYARPEFDIEQMIEISTGFEQHLSAEQINMYSKPEFDSYRMGVIRKGFENGLSMGQVGMFAKTEFDGEQMREIRMGFESGLSMEQVGMFAKTEFNSDQMHEIRDGLEKGFSMEQVSMYAKPEFDYFQKEEIKNGLKNGLSMEQISVYAKPEFNEYQMREIRCGFNEGLSIEQVSVYAKPEFTCVQMSEIESGFKKGLSIEQISMYAKPEFYDYQMNQICRGFKNGLSMEQVSVYAKPEFNTGQMRLIEDGFRNKLSMEQVKTYAKPEFDSNQMWEIENGLDEYKLSIEQVGTYAKPEFDFDQMFEIRRGFINGLSMEQVGMYAKPELSANQIYAAMNGLRNGISTDKINDIINSGMSPEEMSNAMFNEVKKDSTGVIVYRTAHKVFENYYSKTDAFICRTETEAIDLIKEKQLNDYQNQQNYSYSYKVVGKNGDLSKAIREDQRVILAPSYDMAKNINAEATVEAEYGDECLEGTMVTLAHHGPRSGNPAPCNTSDVPKLPSFATVVVSHIDLDTLGGIYALQGRKPEDDRFWEAAEMIDVKGVHHIHELDKDIQDKLNAYYAYNYNHAGERYSETADVTKQVEDAYGVINDILDIDAPEHDMLIADGKEWAQAREAAVEAQLIYEDKNMRVFDSNGVFCAASYYSPKQDALIPATVTYNEKTKTITLGFEDGGKQYNAMEIVRSVWGPEAGGREGIAGSPRGIEMTKDDLHALVERLKEVQASAGVEKNIQNEKDASKKARHSRKKTASSEEEIEL